MNGETEEDVFNGLSVHPNRKEILDEIHARPFPLLKSPLRLVALAFLNSEMSYEDAAAMSNALFRAHGGTPPPEGSRYHRSKIDLGVLRWERHTEFTTFHWRSDPGPEPLTEPLPPGPFTGSFVPPGPLIGGGRFIFIETPDDFEPLLADFDRRSLCISEIEDGRAIIATDFRQDRHGLTRYLIIDRGIGEARAGAVILRLQEIEIYRAIALLGLPVARNATPTVDRIEEQLAEITAEMRSSDALSTNRDLLNRLTRLAGELEAEVSRVSYRMSATRAYDDVLKIRLDALEEHAYPGYGTLETFLARRMNPAIRTCQSLVRRQNELAAKLTRAIDLLRARIALDVENQNVALLNSMNRRAKMQLRLQQTVEGLSIGAISYYLLGIIGYGAKGLKTVGLLPVKPEIVVGIAIPFVVGLVF